MTLTPEQMAQRVSTWMAGTLVTQATTPWMKFKIGFASTQVLPTIRSLVESAKAMHFNMVDQSGNVDTDRLKDAVMAGFGSSSCLSLGGLSFTADDASSFFESLNYS